MFNHFKFSHNTKSLLNTVLEAYNGMGKSFEKSELIKHVQSDLKRDFYESTIMGALIRLKRYGQINYTVIDNYRGIYRKRK